MITKCTHLDCLADKTGVCSRDLKPTSPFCAKAEKSTVNWSVGLAAFFTADGNIDFQSLMMTPFQVRHTYFVTFFVYLPLFPFYGLIASLEYSF